MAITYTWGFPSLDVIYSEDGFQNVVKTVNWTYTAVDDGYSAYRYGSTDLPTPGQPFTQYSDLTPEIVQGWVIGVLGGEWLDGVNASLAAEIESNKNPTSGQMPPPWA